MSDHSVHKLNRQLIEPVKFLIITIAMTSVTYGFGRYAYGLFLPSLRSEFGASTLQLSLIASANAGTYLISTLIASAYAIYFRPTYMMVSSCILTVTGLAIAGFSTTFDVAAFGIIVSGVGGGVLSPALFEAIESWLPEEWKVRAIGAVSAGATPGMIITALVAYFSLDYWRQAWLAMAAVGIFVLLVGFALLPKNKIGKRGEKPTLPLSFSMFMTRRNIGLYIALFVYGVIFSVYLTFSVDLVTTLGALSAPKDRLFWFLLGLTGLPAIFNGYFISKIGYGKFLKVVFVLCAFSYGILALAASSLPFILISAMLFGYASIAIGSGLLVWSIGIFKERPSIGSGVVFFLFSIATILGPILSSVLSPFIEMKMIFAVLALFSIVIVPFLPKDERH